jgi:rubrerythrin
MSAAPATLVAPVGLSAELVTQLQGVLADEYLARDFYLAAAERFGGRQFANLARAEQHHVDAVTRLLRAAGATPVSGRTEAFDLPHNLTEALTNAEAIEREVVAAYEVLLAADTAPAVHRVFENIQAANRRHLAAADR